MGVLPGRGGVPGGPIAGERQVVGARGDDARCRRRAVGYLSLAYAPNVLWAYLGFGVFGGTAAGFVYATCVNMVGKWYPERKGGKTGFVNGGFAYGSVPFIFLFTSYLDVSNYQGTPARGRRLSGRPGGRQRVLLQGPAEKLVARARRPAGGQ